MTVTSTAPNQDTGIEMTGGYPYALIRGWRKTITDRANRKKKMFLNMSQAPMGFELQRSTAQAGRQKRHFNNQLDLQKVLKF